jgi:hypothetical protein
VARAWPFEGVTERRTFNRPEDFVEAFGTEVEAVVIRIGLHDAQLVVVAPNGLWTRWVYHSTDEAKSVADGLGIKVHEGEYPEELRVRINKHVRDQEDFDRAPYPEQGSVGPVIPYPENRPRRLDVLTKEVSEQKDQETPE